MRMRGVAALVAMAVAACDPLGPPAPLHTPSFGAGGSGTYEIRTVGGPALGMHINDGGEVSGQYFGAGHVSAFFWSPETGILEEIPVVSSSRPTHRVNNLGMVAGTYGPEDASLGYRWTRTGGLQALPRVTGSISDNVRGINDAGVVVGSSWIGDELHPVRWSPDGSVGEVLGPVVQPAVAGAINVHGDIAIDDEHGMLIWTPSGTTRVLTVDDAVTRYAPAAINAHREVVGYYVSEGLRRAFYWSSAHGLIDLHATGLSAYHESFASYINDAGEVAIGAGPFSASAAGYVWSRDRGFVPLPSPGIPFRAWGINNHGQVVGSSTASNPEGPVTFVWTPVRTGTLTDALVGAIDDLVADGSLAEPDGNGIRATLTQVQRKIDEGNTRAAINQLRAFINQVRALIQSGRLSPEDGAALIAEAEALIALLS